MIRAQKNPLFNKLIYQLLIKSGLRASFFRVSWRQATLLPNATTPIILFGNHSAWWDGHLAMALNEERWKRDGYVMVEDTQLSRYQFFRAIGAFSVNRKDGRSAMETLNYCVDVLSDKPGRMLLMYPQGEIVANDVRPLNFFSGVGRVVKDVAQRVGACAAYPMALRYEFVGEQKPEAFISVGAPIIHQKTNGTTAKEITTRMQAALTQELDQLREDVVAYRFESFKPLVSGGWSINRLWDAVRGKGQIKQVGRENDEAEQL